MLQGCPQSSWPGPQALLTPCGQRCDRAAFGRETTFRFCGICAFNSLKPVAIFRATHVRLLSLV